MLAFFMTIADNDKRQALETLYNNHSARMYSSAIKILENRQDAEDALQDTFIKIYKNIDKFMSLEGDDLILLIIIYTRNTARDIRRKKQREQKHTIDFPTDSDGDLLFTDIPDDSANVEELVVNKETIAETASFIDSLPTPQREVIILKYRLGMKEKEIAEALGITETAVSSRIHRAKESLRQKLMP